MKKKKSYFKNEAQKLKKKGIERVMMRIPINFSHLQQPCRNFFDPGFCFMYCKMWYRLANTLYLLQCM